MQQNDSLAAGYLEEVEAALGFLRRLAFVVNEAARASLTPRVGLHHHHEAHASVFGRMAAEAQGKAVSLTRKSENSVIFLPGQQDQNLRPS